MPSLGELTFDLALNASGFASKLAEAGRAVSAYASKQTESFSKVGQSFRDNETQLKKGRRSVQDLVTSQGVLRESLEEITVATRNQSVAVDKANKTHAKHVELQEAHRKAVHAATIESGKNREAVAKAKELIDGMTRSIADQREKIAASRAAMAAYQSEAARLKVVVKGTTETKDEVRKAKEAAGRSVAGMETQQSASLKKKNREESEIKRLEREITHLQAKEKNAKTTADRDAIAATILQKQADLDLHRQRMRFYETEGVAMGEELIRRKAEHQRLIALHKEAIALETKAKDDRTAALTGVRDEAAIQVVAEDKIRKTQRILDSFTPQLAAVTAEYEESQRVLNALRLTQDAFNAQTEASSAVLAEQQKKLDQSQESLDKAQASFDKVGKEVETVTESIDEMTKKAATAPGFLKRIFSLDSNADRMHESLEQLHKVTGVVATGWTELNRRMEFVSQGRPLSAISESLGPFERKLERTSRGFRGMSKEINTAQEALYTMQDRMDKVKARHATLEAEYRRHLQTVTNAKQAAAHNDTMIAEREAEIVRQKAERDRALASAASSRRPEDRVAFIADAEKHTATIKRLESSIISIKHNQDKHKLTSEEAGKRAEEYAVRVKVASDAIEKQSGVIDTAREKLAELKKAHKEGAGATQGFVGSVKAKAQALKDAQEPMSTSIRSWLQSIGIQTNLQQSNEKTADSITEVGTAAKRTQNGGWFSWLGSAKNKTNELSQATENQTRTLHSARQAWGSFAEFLRVTVIETMARTTAQFASNMIMGSQNVLQTGYQQVKDFEGVSFSINALMAREYRKTEDSSVGFVEAMEVVQGRTDVLLQKFEKAAIESNFTSKELAGGFAALMQTFTSKESETVLGAITDWGNVMQKQGYELEGVAFVLGQIKNAGKMQTEDFKQLQETYGLNVLDYLGAALGKTTSELKEMMTAGTLLAEDVIPIIVEGLEKDFGGAGEAAGNTFQGISSSILDLGQIALRKVLGPAFEALKEPMKAVVGILQDPMFLEALDRIGASLGETMVYAIDTLSSSLPDFGYLFESVVGSIGETLGSVLGLTDEMWEWGGLVFDAFLEGMMDKIGSIQDVAGWIGDELAYWMEPHSPPKMAPDLDTWGEKTAQTYFDAMGNASAKTPLTQFSGIFEGDQAEAIAQGEDGAVVKEKEDTRKASEKFAEELSALAGVEGIAGTNGLLAHIAKMIAELVDNTMPKESKSSRRKGKPDREPGETSEEYRLRIEEMMKDGKTKEVDEEKKAWGEFKAGIRLLKAEGKYDVALVRYQEALEGMEEGTKEHLDALTEIANLEKTIEREKEKAEKEAEKKNGGGGAKKTDAQKEAERLIKEQKAADDAQIKFLIKTKEYTKAQEILESRLARAQVGTKEYFDTLTKLEDIKAKIAKQEEEGVEVGEGSGRTLVREDTSDPEGEKNAVIAQFDKMRDDVRARIDKDMADFRERIKKQLEPVTDFFEENYEVIKKLTAMIGLKLGVYFFKTKAIPFFRELAFVMGLGANALGKWITPMNMLTVASTLMSIAWIKNIGGFRDVTNAIVSEVQPNLDRIQDMFGDIAKTFSKDGVFGAIDAFTANFPLFLREIQVVIAASQRRIGKWLKPTFKEIQKQAELLFSDMIKWLHSKGQMGLADALEGMLKSVQDNVSKPQFGLFIASAIASTVGVFLLSKFYTLGGELMTKLGAGAVAFGPYLLGVIRGNFPLILGAAAAAIIAYGPELRKAFATWSIYFWDWAYTGLPMLVGALGKALVIATGTVLSAGIELVRILGVVVADGLGKLLPLVPKALDVMRTFILDSALWIVGFGVPQLAYAGLEIATAFINSIAENLPNFAFGLGEFLGKVFWGIAGTFAFATTSIIGQLYFRFLPLLRDKLLPALLDLGVSMFQAVASGFVGAVYGLFLRPVVQSFRALNMIDALAGFFREVGFEAGAEMVEGFVEQLPPWIQTILVFGKAFVEVFDDVMVPLKRFLGAQRDMRTESALLAEQILESRNAMHELQPAVLGITSAMAVLAGGSYLMFFRDASAAAVAHGSILHTKIIPAILAWTATLRTQLFTAIGINIVAVETFNGTVMRAHYTGIAGAIRATYLWIAANVKLAFSLARSVGLSILNLAVMIRTKGVVATYAFIKAQTAATFTTSLLNGMMTALTFQIGNMTIAYSMGGVRAVMTYIAATITATIQTNLLTVAMALNIAAFAAVALAIGGVVWAWQKYNQEWEKGMRRALESNGAWVRAKQVLEEYALSTEGVRAAHYDTAKSLRDLQHNVEVQTKELADLMTQQKQWWRLGFVPSDEDIAEQRRVLQEANDQVTDAAQKLEDEMYQREAKNYIAATTVRGYADAVRDISAAVPQTVEDMKDLNQQFQDTITKGYDAMNTLIDIEQAFRDDRERDEEDHQERMTRLVEEGERQRQQTEEEAQGIFRDRKKVYDEIEESLAKTAQLELELSKEKDEERRAAIEAQLEQELARREELNGRAITLTEQHQDALTKLEKDAHLERVKEEEAAQKERETARALAYVRERQQARQRLGEVFIEQLEQRKAMLLSDKNLDMTQRAAIIGKAAMLRATLYKEYGIQEDASAKTYEAMGMLVENFTETTEEEVTKIAEAHQREMDALKEKQDLYAELEEDVVTQLITEYEGAGEEALKDALDTVPERVEVLIQTKLNDPSGILGEKPEVRVEVRPFRGPRLNPDGEQQAPVVPRPPTTRPPTTRPPGSVEPRAKGGPVRPFQMYEVVENEPEMLRVAGRTLLMMGAHGGEVIPSSAFSNQMRGADRLAAPLQGLSSPRRAESGVGGSAGRMTVSMPITISGNTIREDGDIDRIRDEVTENIINILNRVVLKGVV